MVKRYYKNEAEIEIKDVEIYECPDCGFEFNAYHEVDDEVGGYECPLCERDELQDKVQRLETELMMLR